MAGTAAFEVIIVEKTAALLSNMVLFNTFRYLKY